MPLKNYLPKYSEKNTLLNITTFNIVTALLLFFPFLIVITYSLHWHCTFAFSMLHHNWPVVSYKSYSWDDWGEKSQVRGRTVAIHYPSGCDYHTHTLALIISLLLKNISHALNWIMLFNMSMLTCSYDTQVDCNQLTSSPWCCLLICSPYTARSLTWIMSACVKRGTEKAPGNSRWVSGLKMIASSEG